MGYLILLGSAGCCLIFQSIPQGVDPQLAELSARVPAPDIRQVIHLGVFLLVGGRICTLVPIVQRRQKRASTASPSGS